MSLVRFLTPAEARAGDGIKWTTYGPDVLAAWVAVMDVEIAEPIRAAIVDAAQRSVTGYPNPHLHGTADLISRWHRDRHGSVVDPSLVRYGSTVTNAILQAFEVFSEPGDRVILTTPVYHPFFEAADIAGLHQVRVSMVCDGDRHRMNLDRIEEEAAKGGVILLCQPHNPTGSIATRAELKGVAAIAARHGNPVISDEIHAALAMPGRASVAFADAAPDLAGQTITVASATKAFNLPGLRLAWLVAGSEELATRLDQVPFLKRYGYSSIGFPATRAALTDGGAWLDELREHLAARQVLLSSLLATHLPDARWSPPEATYLAWIDLTAYGLDDPTPALLEAGVALSPGTQFGDEGTGFVRLNLAAHEATLTAIVERMGMALAR